MAAKIGVKDLRIKNQESGKGQKRESRSQESGIRIGRESRNQDRKGVKKSRVRNQDRKREIYFLSLDFLIPDFSQPTIPA
jgi:hypothetical protein